MFKARFQQISPLMREKDLDALLACRPSNIRYLTGYRGEDALLLVRRRSMVLITDGRYTEEAGRAVRPLERAGVHCRIMNREGSFHNALERLFRKPASVGVEEEEVSHAFWKRIKKALPKGSRLHKADNLLTSLRRTKDRSEAALIRKAVKVAELAFEKLRSAIHPGMKEIEAARKLDEFMLQLGAEGPSFPTIVASGPNSSRPHHESGTRRIRRNDIVLIDWGARWKGYVSDLTRVLFTGKIRPEWENAYRAVLKAHEAALQAAGKGVPLAEPGEAVREILRQRRLDDGILHGPGHGIGLDIHEQPGLSNKAVGELMKGDFFTIEPGIYRKGGFGIRIEDDYYVDSKGRPARLSRLPRDLHWASGG